MQAMFPPLPGRFASAILPTIWEPAASGLISSFTPWTCRRDTAGWCPPPPRIAAVAARSARPHLASAPDHVFEGGELLHADGAARVQAPRGDADLRPHAELAAVGELGR